MDEDSPHREAYRLQRLADGEAVTIAIFYSAKEALAIMPSLDARLSPDAGRQASLAWPSFIRPS